MKTCNRCKESKDLIEFPVRKYKSGHVGNEHNCFECKRYLNREDMRKKRADKEWQTSDRKRQKERRRENPTREMFKRSKKRAQRKGMSFSISEKDILIPDICPLVEIPLIIQDGIASDNSPSLDRIDSTLGYVPGNVRVISRLANIMKAHADIKTLKTFIKNLPKYITTEPS